MARECHLTKDTACKVGQQPKMQETQREIKSNISCFYDWTLALEVLVTQVKNV